MGLLNLLYVASMPVVKVLLITALGLFLALDNVNLLGEDARKYLNEIVFYVFNPALVGSNLAKTITFNSFVTLWFMPVNIFLTFLIGSALGWLLVKLTKAPKNLHGLIIGSCSAGNLGNLLMIIVPALCARVGNPFGEADVCQSNALAYASLSMAPDYIIKSDETMAKEVFGEDLKALLAPSTTGVIIGFLIGMISPIRKLLIGSNAPLHVLEDTAFLIGDAAIPAVTLILGANLLQGLKGVHIQLRNVFGIVIIRFIILPVIGICIVKGAVHFGIVQSDPLFQFFLLLQYSLPPAMNIGTITQLFGAGRIECSVIMLWTYALSSVALTLWCTFFLWLVAQ